MMVQAEVGEDGVVRVCDPKWRGQKILLSFPEEKDKKLEGRTNWEELWKIFKQADQLDIPRRTPDEIMDDLREIRK